MKSSLSFSLLFFAFAAIVRADDETDFTTAPPGNWARLNPLGIATFTISGGTCRIDSPEPSLQVAQIFGLARAALLGPTEWTQVAASVDLLAWSPDQDRAFNGVFVRVPTQAGLGATYGYALTVLNFPPSLYLYRLDNEVPTLIAGPLPVPADRTRRYRLVLTAAGSALTGRYYDTADLATPLAELATFDSTYPSGRAGLVSVCDELAPITGCIFDNFLAWDGTPPPVAISAGLIAGTAVISRELRRGLASRIEQTYDLLPAAWENAFPDSSAVSGDRLESTITLSGDSTFYRLRLLGTVEEFVPPAPPLLSGGAR